MTSRERVLNALNHKATDRVPRDLGGFISTIERVAYEKLLVELGLDETPRMITKDHTDPSETILQRFNIDTRYLHTTGTAEFTVEEDGTLSYYDAWGVKQSKPRSSYYFDPVSQPLANADVADLDSYNWPDLAPAEKVRELEKQARRLRATTDKSIVLDLVGPGIFEQSWIMRGMEQFMVDMYLDKRFAVKLMNKILEIQGSALERILNRVGEFVDVVVIADDLGSENGQLISGDMYRNLIKPLHKQLCDLIHSKTSAKIMIHSCGAVRGFIKDFIDAGIEILNPVQVSAAGMSDTRALKAEFGKDIVFWGAISQHILTNGTPEDVRAEVERRIDDLSEDGGFVLAPAHNIQPTVPPKNILALFGGDR